jgi:hypothetical protein
MKEQYRNKIRDLEKDILLVKEDYFLRNNQEFKESDSPKASVAEKKIGIIRKLIEKNKAVVKTLNNHRKKVSEKLKSNNILKVTRKIRNFFGK